MEPKIEQITNRYENLLKKSLHRWTKIKIGRILIGCSFLFIISFSIINSAYNLDLFQPAGQSTEPIRIISGIVGGVFLGMLFLGAILMSKNEKIIFDKQQKIFFEFYHTYVILQKYVDLKSKKELKNAVRRIDGLMYYIGQWTDKRSPDPISNIPQSIQKNLKEKIYSRIKQEKINELTEFIEKIRDFAYTVYENQPTESDLLKLNGFLNSMEKIPEIKPSKILEPFEKRAFIKPAIVSIVITTILVGVLINSEIGWGQIVLGSVGVGAVIFFGLYKRKSS